MLIEVQALNPGNLKSDLQRHMPGYQAVLIGLLLHTPIHGAYTELFAGLSPEVTPAKTGAWSKSTSHESANLTNKHSHTLGAFRETPRRF
jgi:hypothetical protein